MFDACEFFVLLLQLLSLRNVIMTSITSAARVVMISQAAISELNRGPLTFLSVALA
jgi:hypothetical protein